MKAMLLAAGRGERLRPLTDSLPKPLLPLGDTTLIEIHLAALARAGFKEAVINLRYLGHLIEARLGDGARYGISIAYSREAAELETGGGVKQALPLLGGQPFALINADVHTDFNLALLKEPLPPGSLGRLVLADNPSHHPEGDFGLQKGRLTDQPPRLTYTGLATLHPDLLAQAPATSFKLKQALAPAIASRRLHGRHHPGHWQDIGAPARYARLQFLLAEGGRLV